MGSCEAKPIAKPEEPPIAKPEEPPIASPSCGLVDALEVGLGSLTLEEEEKPVEEKLKEEEKDWTGDGSQNAGHPEGAVREEEEEEVEEEQEKGDDLGLGSSSSSSPVKGVKTAAAGGIDNGERFQFPVRPGDTDCAFYVRSGTCKFGMNCRFNHPQRRRRYKKDDNEKEKDAVPKGKEQTECKAVKGNSEGPLSENVSQKDGQAFKENEKEALSAKVEKKNHKVVQENEKRSLPTKVGRIKCKFYSMPLGCKFGKHCKFSHDEISHEAASVELNFLGLPMRPGEKDCPYYMRNGGCSFATNCRYHHPDPAAVGSQDLSTRHQNQVSPQLGSSGPSQLPATSWPLQRSLNEPVPFIDASTSYLPGTFKRPEWEGYQGPIAPFCPSEMLMPHAVNSAMMDHSKEVGISMHQQAQVDEYAQRPGQPNCQNFMKTGSCKFRLACKFHHPKAHLL